MTVALWCGKPLTEYTQEELIKIIEFLNERYEQGIEQKHHEISMLRRM